MTAQRATRMKRTARPRRESVRASVLWMGLLLGCGTQHVTVTGPVLIDHRLPLNIFVDSSVPSTFRVPGHGSLPEVTLDRFPALLSRSLANGESAGGTLALSITALDFEGTQPADVRLALDDTVVSLAHGGSPDAHNVHVAPARYVRIAFRAELMRGGIVIGRTGGTVTGSKRVGTSENSIRGALGSALGELARVLDRELLARRTASLTAT